MTFARVYVVGYLWHTFLSLMTTISAYRQREGERGRDGGNNGVMLGISR